MEPKLFPPDIESVEAIQCFVKAEVSAFNPDKKTLLRIDLVIEEIVVNIVKYGFDGIDNGAIEICVDVIDNSAVLEIFDNGPEFNPMAQTDPDITFGVKQRLPGGLGIFLVKQIAKEVEYERRNNKNRIRLWLDL